MPTSRVRYVDAGSTGGDGTTRDLSGASAAYATLNAALVAEYAANPNLVSADILLTIQCVGTSADGGAQVGTSTAPFTTDATRYLIVETPLADRTANPWVWSTSRYRWSRAQSGALWNARNVRVVLRGLQIENTRDGTDARVVVAAPNSSNATHQTVEECLLRMTGAANNGNGIGCDGSVAATFINRNNIIIGSGSTTGTGISHGNSHASAVAYCYNNTIAVKSVGISGSATFPVTSTNNLVSGATTCFSGTLTQSYDASSDATAAGTGSRASQTFTFNGAGDYRLSGSDAGARTYGTDLSGATNGFTTDYGQTTRTVPWDIGAHQVSVAAASGRRERITRGLHRGLSGVGV